MKGSFQSNQDCLKSRSDLGHGFDSSLCTRQKCATSAGSPQQSVSHGCFHGVSLASARWTPFLAWSFHEISRMGPMHTSVDIHSRHTNQMSIQNSSKAAQQPLVQSLWPQRWPTWWSKCCAQPYIVIKEGCCTGTWSPRTFSSQVGSIRVTLIRSWTRLIFPFRCCVNFLSNGFAYGVRCL